MQIVISILIGWDQKSHSGTRGSKWLQENMICTNNLRHVNDVLQCSYTIMQAILFQFCDCVKYVIHTTKVSF